jgi:hypothetical protein
MKFNLSVALGLVGMVAVAPANWYTDQTQFLSQLAGPYYVEQFSNFTYGNPLNGNQNTWIAPGGNGYGFSASAEFGLWSNPSALSTNNSGDPIVINPTGNATAVGMLVSGSDINGNVIPGVVTITLSNNQQQILNTTGFSFIGWASPNAVITSISISVDQTGGANWPAVDDVHIGTAVPEPGTMAALALGGMALLRRRKKA